MPSTPRCSVVIPHLQETEPLFSCLESLRHQSVELEIILVDNASTDGSVEKTLTAFPDVRVVRSRQNLGYAGGANLGLAHVEGRWCIFMNDDAVAAPGAIEALLEVLENAPEEDIPILQPTIRSSSDTSLFDYAGGAGGLIDSWGYPFALGRLFEHLERDTGQYELNGPLAWASGCCIAGATETFRILGGFEESFFAHFEEIDLCWRHRRNGGKIESVPRAIVYHQGSSTLPEGTRKTYLNFRNSLWTLRRNHPAGRLLLVIGVRFFLDAAAALRWLFTGKISMSLAVARGWITGLLRKPWGKIFPERSLQPARGIWGTYQGSVAIACYLRGVRRAGELLHEVSGWEPPVREREREEDSGTFERRKSSE